MSKVYRLAMTMLSSMLRRLGQLKWPISIVLTAFVFCSILLALVAFQRELWLSQIARDAGRLARDYHYPWIEPQIEWETAAPESQGFTPVRLDSMRDSLAESGTKSFLVVRSNRLVYEWYALGWNPNKKHGSASLAKALAGGMSLWISIGDGTISLDEPAWRYIPDWKDDPLKSRISVRQLAMHTSGLHGAEIGDNPDEVEDWVEAYWTREPDPFSIAIDQAPVVFSPGSGYMYSPPGYSALAYAISASLHNASEQNIYMLLKERVMQPLGVPDSDWSIGYNEEYLLDNMLVYEIRGGGRFTPRAAARIGQLVLNRGSWNGAEIADPAALDELIHAETLDNLPPGIPYPVAGGWVSNANMAIPSLPDDAIVGIGSGNQILLIIPSLDLVVVRKGEALTDAHSESEVWRVLDEVFFAPIIEAIDNSN